MNMDLVYIAITLALLAPASGVGGSASDALRLAEIQERWATRIGALAFAAGLLAGGFSVPLGVAIALPGVIFAIRLRADAAFVRMSVNRHVIIRLQREALLKFSPRGSGDATPG
jgi:hypothetical protein